MLDGHLMAKSKLALLPRLRFPVMSRPANGRLANTGIGSCHGQSSEGNKSRREGKTLGHMVLELELALDLTE